MAKRIVRYSKTARWACWCAVTLPFLTAPALAAENDGDASAAVSPAEESSEILVVAERRAERLQDIPISIVSLSAERLDKAGIGSTLDLGTLASGLNFTSATGSSAPFLRGVGNNNVGPAAESSVATYVDGVYYSSVTSTVFSLTGVRQVDVLKGPQGTLFGRNATGGVIQITTKDPDQGFGGDASISYGNYDTISAKGYVTGGLGTDLAMNLAVAYDHQGDGYGTNLTTGNEANKTKSLSLRSKLVWQPDTETKITVAGDFSDLDTSQGISWRPTYGTVPISGPPFTGGVQDIYSAIDPYTRSRQGGVSLKVEKELGFAQLVSISAYRREVVHSLVAIDQGLTTQLLAFRGRKFSDQYTQEIQLIGPSDSRVKWVAGLYGFYLKGGYDPLTGTGTDTAPFTSLLNVIGQKTWSGAAFGQVTIDGLLPDTDFTAGGRYTVERRTASIAATGFFGDTPVPLGADDGEDSWSSPTWRFSLDHRFSQQAVGYVSYNRGFKSGTFNTLSIPLEPVKPETLDAYETGLKLELMDRKLRINGSVFYYNFRDMQVPRYTGTTVTLSNAGKARMYGFDLDLDFVPTPSLRIAAGLSLLDAKYKEFEEAVFSEPAPGGGSIITTRDAAGNQVMLSPDAQANASLNYVLPGRLNAFEFNITYSYNDGWFSDPDNLLRQPSFHLVNTQLTWTVPGERFRLTVWGRNLANEVYAQYLSDQSFYSNVTSVSSPRTYGITLAGQF